MYVRIEVLVPLTTFRDLTVAASLKPPLTCEHGDRLVLSATSR